MLHAGADKQGAQGGQKRRDTQPGDQSCIETTHYNPGQQSPGDGNGQAMAAIEQYYKGHGGKIHRRAHRQVDASRRHRPGHANGNQRQQHKVIQQQAAQVAKAQEAGCVHGEKAHDQHNQQRQNPPQQTR